MSEIQPRFEKHILVCTNQRPPESGRRSCGNCGGDAIHVRLAELLKQHGLKGCMRVSKTGCLDACELGPALVIYPQELWYIGVKTEDVDEIFNTSILNDGVVERLLASAADWQHLKALRLSERS